MEIVIYYSSWKRSPWCRSGGRKGSAAAACQGRESRTGQIHPRLQNSCLVQHPEVIPHCSHFLHLNAHCKSEILTSRAERRQGPGENQQNDRTARELQQTVPFSSFPTIHTGFFILAFRLSDTPSEQK